MKMIPDNVQQFPGNSAAEKTVFSLLKESSVEGFALHSLNLRSHRYKKWAEIDFFCVTPSGVLAIEVKGGKLSRQRGQWFTNNNPLKESPFDQVKGGMYALVDLLPDDLKGVTFGWGVVFPESDRIPETPENPEVMQGDFRACRTQADFDEWLKALLGHWSSKVGKRASRTPRDLDGLVRKLRPNFEAPMPLGEHARRLNESILHFSEEQFERLDEISENDRIICKGGAGTGKTFLALETARREAALGSEVLFVARSSQLVSWIRSGLPVENITVLTADELRDHAAGDDAFDVLVVDEGQDLLVLHYLEVLDGLLRGGFAAGRWRWFMDDQNQAGLHEDTTDSALELLQSGATLKRLRKNCRNTKEIVQSTQFTTGADIGEAELAGIGKSPKIAFVEPDTECRTILRCLSGWHDEGVGWDRMVVLVCDTRERDRIDRGLEGRARVETVRDFKGLEADFVALAGIPSAPGSLELLRAEIYTGMTRARIHLLVAVPSNLESAWQSIREENASRMFSAEEEA